jgi:hypothetical protein
LPIARSLEADPWSNQPDRASAIKPSCGLRPCFATKGWFRFKSDHLHPKNLSALEATMVAQATGTRLDATFEQLARHWLDSTRIGARWPACRTTSTTLK